MERFDAIVVGGGPAGSTCAWKLVREGMTVAVIDRKVFPRDKPCAGWITPQVVESLKLDVNEYRRDRTWQPINGFLCGMIRGKSVPVEYDHSISFGIRRREFDHFLLARSGAQLRLNEAVHELTREGGQWTVNGRYTAPMLVGAGGHRCPVARRLGARDQPAASVVVAREVEFRVAKQSCGNVDPMMPQLFFCSDLQGYGWCLRKGEYLNVGLGRTCSDGLLAQVDEFVAFLKEHNQLACEFPKRWMGHAYQLYENVVTPVCDEGVLLVGDAAGLAYATSGEGIRPAVESGLVAARVILGAKGSYDRESLGSYQTELSGRFGKPKQLGIAHWLPTAWLNGLGSLLLTNRQFCQQVLLDKWFLHRRQEAMVI